MNAAFALFQLCPNRPAIVTDIDNYVHSITTLDSHFDNSLLAFSQPAGAAGGQTSLFDERHLGHGDRR